jgi:hypothetical protein
MPIPTPASLPKAGWAVLLYGPPPEIQFLAGELDDNGLEIVRIDGGDGHSEIRVTRT